MARSQASYLVPRQQAPAELVPVSPPGAATHNDAARAVIIDEDIGRGMDLAEIIQRIPSLLVTVIPAMNRLPSDGAPPALALISVEGSAPLGAAEQLMRTSPESEIILFCADLQSPEVAAAQALGVKRIMERRSMINWLTEAAPHLMRVVALRRALARATACIPTTDPSGAALAPISASALRGQELLPLPTAEARFREMYLRQLVLLEGGNRHAVARRAGVPYRTICHILHKLGIVH
jgi:hypothetical protein